MSSLPLPSEKYKNLNKTERAEARKRIEKYHQKKLADLQKVVFDNSQEFYKGKINAFELDQIIHIYHKQSQELFSFINEYYPTNDGLLIILSFIDAEEKGEWKWIPKTKMEDIKNEKI